MSQRFPSSPSANPFSTLVGESAYALLYRPETHPDVVELLVGTARSAETLVDGVCDAGGDTFVLVPYRQIGERGFACHDDGTPLVSIAITARHTMSLADAVRFLPEHIIDVRDGEFDISDAAYADRVRAIIASEIGAGAGSNFVIRRSFNGCIDHYSPAVSLALFRRLLIRESGTYWTFLVTVAGRTLVGATPEGHIRVDGDVVTMNPISGTYRYPAGGPDLPGVLDFLADRKESDELYMVLDEELKMMTGICEDAPTVTGPLAQADGQARAHRISHFRPQPRRPRSPSCVTACAGTDRDRQPDRERVSGHPPSRTRRSRLLQRRGGTHRKRGTARRLRDPDSHRRHRRVRTHDRQRRRHPGPPLRPGQRGSRNPRQDRRPAQRDDRRPRHRGRAD